PSELKVTIHGAGDAAGLQAILARFAVPANAMRCLTFEGSETAGSVVAKLEDDVRVISVPSARVGLDNETIVYATDIEFPELVDAYMVSYALSMLSRYYPDLWVK